MKYTLQKGTLLFSLVLVIIGTLFFAPKFAIAQTSLQSTTPAKSTFFSYFTPKCTVQKCTFTFIAPVPIVGLNINSKGEIDLTNGEGVAKYMSGIYMTMIAVAAALATIMVLVGGVQYATTDAFSVKEEGKKRIKAAFAGLALALLAYSILNFINPYLVNTNFNPPAIDTDPNIGNASNVGVPNSDGSVTPVTGGDTELSTVQGGYQITPTKVAIDTDGTERPPFNDPDWQNQTSLPGLNANTDAYVVVPIGSDIPLGTKVTVYNNTNKQSVQAIVGDRGPGFGEMSLAAAKAIGVWKDGMGNAVIPGQSITYTFHTNTNTD